MHRLLCLITHRHHTGGLKVPAPIFSRVYQELSNGMLGANAALTLTEVQFPFAFAQVVHIGLWIFAATFPILAASFTTSPILATMLTFATVSLFVGLNEVAIVIEDPFGNDLTDIPLQYYHSCYNNNLKRLLRERP